jgi:tetratricopeptide (TPR) repeat protein
LAKRKIRRKELKKPDEFITLTGRIMTWCRENVRFVGGAAAAIGLFLLLSSAVLIFKANREAKARALYGEAIALYPAGVAGGANVAEYVATIAKLEEVKQQYGSTTAATSARIDLGNAFFQSGDYDRAATCYLDFIERTDSKHPFHDQVLVSLGETYEAKGSLEKALEIYQKLAREGASIYQSQAQLHLGRVYEALGDQEKAVTHYDNYLKENPATLFSEWIRTKIIRWQQKEALEDQG